MIYIDPPYNTGNDFIYADDFMRSQEEENAQMGRYDEDKNRLFKNTDTNGRFHSDWCSMIYSRLMLARNLLTDDGVIFISIDDNEQENLEKICDEVFGRTNMVGMILWKKKTNGNNMGFLPPVHDYILCYAKSIEMISEMGYPVTNEFISKTFSNPDDDARGPWTTSDLSANH
ncbi:DNA methyltransferase, partial [Methanobrevibacter smithii]|uniref:DNA methyltransferase n=1 Tax=Methanobrevibacter smithii TaxID=2173 RepID=UPI0037DD4765